jgi:hypothetical protein
MRRFALALPFAALAWMAMASPAAAQVHWDMSAEVALEKRFLRSLPAGGNDAGFGPLFRATAHLALLPLARVGVYGALGLSPVSSGPLRTQFGGGLEARLVPPLGLTNIHPSLFVGVGYIRTVTPAYDVVNAQGGYHTNPTSGGCLDIPLGLGATYRLRKPVELGLVLGTRFSAVCHGDSYPDNPTPTLPTTPNTTFTVPSAVGKDIFGLWLGAIVNFEF